MPKIVQMSCDLSLTICNRKNFIIAIKNEMMFSLDLIKKAIESNEVISFNYKGGNRIVEPFTLGYHSVLFPIHATKNK